MRTNLIKTEAENEAALARLAEIFDAEPGTAEGDEAELLTALIEKYEREAYLMELPDAIEAPNVRVGELREL
jgi:HTH-type transcriptional regulator/antitoxin HigA